jgi:hypothetical protein
MAVTFADITSRVKQQLLGYSKDQASITFLADPMTATDTTFNVDVGTVKSISRGLVEIDDELILVNRMDQSTGTVTVMANLSGRGVEGTTPSAHSVDAIVTDDPVYPLARVKEAINDTIQALYPDLWVFGEYEFPKIAARYEYPLPVDVEDVYKVTVNTIGPSAVWFPLSSWRFNPLASTTPGQVKPTPTPTGKTLQIMRDFVVPGRNIRVSYTKKPNTLTANADDFETTTGFPERYIDMVVYGACWRLLPAYEAARLQQKQIEATERAPLVPTGAGADASKFYLQLYTKRLTEERDRLQRLFESYQSFNG